MSRKVLLLINPKARQGNIAWDQARESLTELGLDPITPALDSPKQFSALIRHYQDQVDGVVIGGGDGSVNAALPGVLDTHLPVGVLPLGTANNLARTLELPQTIPEACQVIAAGHRRSIDLGWVNGQYFLNVAGIGLSTRVNQQVEHRLKRRWGVIAYGLTALKLILKYRRVRAQIQCNGELIHVKTYQITVCNGRYYGSGLTVAADATIDDQRLDLCSLEIQSLWQIFLLPFALIRGEYAAGQGIRTLHSEEITIYTRHPYPIDTDGEITTQTPATFRVIPNAITVFVPKKTSDAPP